MQYSINKQTNRLVKSLIDESNRLNLLVEKGPLGSTIVDAGIKTTGSIEAGLKISEICLGGLGNTSITPNVNLKSSFANICVHASNPVIACLGSQYAGWSLSHEDFFSLGSGPARSLAQKEEIFSKISYKDNDSSTSIILEVDKYPPKEIVSKISKDCKVESKNIYFILTPTTSICGNIQVVSRVLEVAIHKIHELNFPLERIISGFGMAPLPPIAKDFISGMGRTNDAIIYGGNVQLFVDGNEQDIEDLSKKLPSSTSKDFGKPFKQIFQDYDNDFYKIDGSLFSPASVIINSSKTGKSYLSGRIDYELIESSFST